MAILNRDMFEAIRQDLVDQNSELVEIMPNVQVRVAQLTARAGFELVNMSEGETEEDKNRLSSYRWIAACCVDDDGKPVFTIEDVEGLPFELVQRLAKAVNKVNGIASSAGEEEAEKNSGEAIS